MDKAHYTLNTKSCASMKLRMVIGGWTDYYVKHSDDWVAFNVHGTRVNVYDDNREDDKITFQWDFNTLTTTVGGIVKAMTLVDEWLEIG